MSKLFFFLLASLFLPLYAGVEPKEVCRRVQAHLLLAQSESAVDEAKAAAALFPEAQDVQEMLILSLASHGQVEEMMKVWDTFAEKFPEQSLNQDLLEEMCFGILHKGQKARGTAPQLISLIGAGLTQDSRAVHFLLEGMRHSNAVIREISIELGSLYGDYALKAEIEQLLRKETVSDVRIALIKAVGQLKMERLYKDLLEIISDPKSKVQEKRAAIQAVVELREYLDQNELVMLIKSPRAELRLLGCEVISAIELKQHLGIVTPLLKDPHPEVQAAALRAMGFLKADLEEKVRDLAKSAHDPIVGITAAWVCLICGSEEDADFMRQWLFHGDVQVARLAAGAIASSGSFGVCLAKEGLEKCEDPYILANLAIALIGQREDCERACVVLDTFLHTVKENCMWDEAGHFKILQKSNLVHNPAIANFPEIVDQTVRLEVLNLLAILEYPKAQDSIKEFLKARHYGVTGLAAETLLGEGDASAIELVRELLTDKDREVRFEAALVLATWGKDPLAIPTLLDMYPKASRELKIKILEALGGIGDKKAIPFLIEQMKTPSLILRMIASCILLRTLNH